MTVAGEGQVPVGQLLGQQAPKPSKWRALTRWRDWSLPVKLGAVTLVPILIALALGAVTLTNQVNRSDRYDRIDRLVAFDASVRGLLEDLQQERARTAALLTEGTGVGGQELAATRGEVDRGVQPVTGADVPATDRSAALEDARARVAAQLGRLPEIREQVGAGRLGTVDAVSEYSAVTDALLDLETAVVAGISDEEIGGAPSALHDLLVAREAVSIQQALIGYGIERGGLAPSELNQVRTQDVRLAGRIDEFRAAATEDQRWAFSSAVLGSSFDTRQRIVDSVLDGQGAPGGNAFRSVTAQQWTDASSAVLAGLGEVGGRLGSELTALSGDLADHAATAAGLLAVLLFAALVLAAVVVFVITRQLLRSLRVLRTGALEVARSELPAAVRTIQEGRSQSTEIRPVPVATREEIGEVARAFDAVHREALRLAVEQAAMRTGFASVFVNLSRRSQSLVQRQLQLIERLERDEVDADQLATLFQLDHLATRMRRNNENLMVLSGSEPGRRSGQPISATDVLRAAVSEIEQYQRVVVRTPPQVRVVGYAASDLMRLIAELLDNATAFSAPETQVTVVTSVADDRSLSVDILDKGIGMNEAEVAEANARLAEAGSLDLATSRRMGLFVVGRLAGRHGFGVSLHGGKDIVGVRATVTVPAELAMNQEAPEAPQEVTRQQRAVNGATRPAGLPGSAGGRRSSAPPPSDKEVSGTALFSPIGRDEPAPRAAAGPPVAPAQRSPQEPPAGQDAGNNGVAAPPVNGHEPAVPAQGSAATEPARQEQRTAEQDDPDLAGEPERQTTDEQRAADAKSAADEQQQRELPSGKRLFEANGTTVSDWWSAATTAADAERRVRKATVDDAETTPIFDEMLSAWFRSMTAPEPERGGGKTGEGATTSSWDFASDESWRAVQAVSQVAPTDYTQAGLPRRRRGEKLLPGSATGRGSDAAGEGARKVEPPSRDPADVRGRLSSFQKGVSRGRRHSQGEPSGVVEAPRQAQEERGWPAAADHRRAAAPPAAESASASGFTQAGLPRRRRGERLLPGSAASPQAAAESRPRTERDPADVRGRLSSFQQGIRRGRHRTAQAAEGNEEESGG